MKLITSSWIALNIGNSRLHWALFEDDQIRERYNTPHIAEESVIWLNDRVPNSATGLISLVYQSVPGISIESELWVASVVPKQIDYWRNIPNFHCISLSEIPLHRLYPTLGVDRALALWGALQLYRSPALVIDCGTAMTFTGANEKHELIGGAIVPGVRLQFQALGQQTAALPTIEQVEILPERWATSTGSAIESGILYTLLAGIRGFIKDWNQQFEKTAIVLTGGDAELIYRLLEQTEPQIFERVQLDLDLVFWGMRSIRDSLRH